MQCEHIKADGERCRAAAVAGSTFCFFHDPTKKKERKAARRKGGQRSKPQTMPDADAVSITEITKIPAFLSGIITATMRGELDHRVANTLGYLGNVLLKSLQAGELEERIRALEEAAGIRRDGG